MGQGGIVDGKHIPVICLEFRHLYMVIIPIVIPAVRSIFTFFSISTFFCWIWCVLLIAFYRFDTPIGLYVPITIIDFDS